MSSAITHHACHTGTRSGIGVTSAAANAGVSLIPSPTITTPRPLATCSLITVSLFSGNSSA